MIRILAFLGALLALAGCETGSSSGGGGIPRLGDPATVRFAHADSVNALRSARGLGEVQLSATLSATLAQTAPRH